MLLTVDAMHEPTLLREVVSFVGTSSRLTELIGFHAVDLQIGGKFHEQPKF